MTFKQIFLINSDLNMGKGKIAVQAAHGEMEEDINNSNTNTEIDLSHNPRNSSSHNSENKINSLSCVVVEPLLEEKCDELFGHLKLL